MFSPTSPRVLAALVVFAGAAGSLAAQIGLGPPPPAAAAQPHASFDYYSIQVDNWHPQLRVQLIQRSGGGADLYLQKNAPPTRGSYHFRSATPGTSNELIVVNGGSTPILTSGTWHIGVWRPDGTNYDLSYATEPIASARSGMGATLYGNPNNQQGGTAFRVWAPFASAVYVAGDFNGWNGGNARLSSEGNGNWSLDVRNVGAGTHYQYVIRNGTQTLWRNDPQAKEVTNSAGDSRVVDPDAFSWLSNGYGTPPWNDLVVYELHVGTFHDTPGGPVGTFATAIQRLDHLAGLGVNCIELMPICEFAGDYSWGYNYGHPFAIESAYGDVDRLKEFVDEAHLRGIAVLTDVVYNHWGPTDMDLWRFDGWSLGPWGGIYFYNDDRAITPWGDTRPDYGRGEVRQYIRDNALYFLQEFHLDGLRWDSTNNIRDRSNGTGGALPEGWSLLQWINDEIDWTQGWKISIAEDMQNNEWVTKDTGAGGAGFDAQWDPDFVHPIRNQCILADDGARSMATVRDAILHRYNGDAFERVIYTDNHDEAANGKTRLPEAIWPGNADSWFSKKRSTLGAALVLTAPGIPMLLQGQELLEDGWFSDTDPLDWSRLSSFGGITNLYRDLIRLRRDWWNHTAGLKGQHVNVHHVNDADKVIAFHRYDQGGPGDDVVVVMNWANRGYSSYNLGFPRGGTWRVRFNSDWNGYDAAFGNWSSFDTTANVGPKDGMSYNANVGLGPYTCIILSQ